MTFDKKCIKEHNKTWYWYILINWPWKYQESPENWITMTPVRMFGKVIAYKCKIAKSNYKWNQAIAELNRNK